MLPLLREALQGAVSELEGDSCILFKNANEWAGVRKVSNPTAPHGFTWNVWGNKPTQLDEQARSASFRGKVMIFTGVEEDAEVVCIVRKYFAKGE